MLGARYGLNQSGTGWTQCGLTPKLESLTPDGESHTLTLILGNENLVEGDALKNFFFCSFEFEDGIFEFALI